MTDDDLAAIAARAAAATPGPWAVNRPYYALPPDAPWPYADGAPYAYWLGTGDETAAELPDLLFMAAARTDIPALLAEIARLRAVLDP